MAELSKNKRGLTIKIVYYGPALSGKTTNLIHLHESLERGDCGDLMSFETRGDRTLFFDLLPLKIRGADGMGVKIKLFTVPGQVAHDATRKAVLSRSDGVVFVADSQATQMINNYESFENLEKNVARVGMDIETLPLVIQFNKRDLKNAVGREEIMARWQPSGLPVLFSSALYGRGVRRTFETILEETHKRLDRQYGLTERYGLNRHEFVARPFCSSGSKDASNAGAFGSEVA